MARRNFLIEGGSGTGKTTVCLELRRRGHRAINGDRELAYQGDPLTGKPIAGATGVAAHRHHLWDIERVRSIVADREDDVAFFCGGSRNVGHFIGLFDQVFVLTVDLDTLRRRLDRRPADEWGGPGRTEERQFIERLHATGEELPPRATVIDATAPLSDVVDDILRRCSRPPRANDLHEAVHAAATAGAVGRPHPRENCTLEVVPHDALTPSDTAELRRLFDAEYLAEYGPWAPDLPYGYAPHDVHVIARSDRGVIGHVGWQRRVIAVGAAEVTVAGVGGVLVSAGARGEHLGRRLMVETAASMSDTGGIDFGYLGCREEVAAFYISCGWRRISAAERSISREGRRSTYEAGSPMLILPIDQDAGAWPGGLIDLRGRAW
jgi:aminoglycoside 2'-N-acetyltransferase I